MRRRGETPAGNLTRRRPCERSGDDKGAGDSRVQRRQFGPMRLGQSHQVVHGNESSISLTEAVVSGGSSGEPAKTLAPVRLLRTSLTAARACPPPRALRRRNSDRLSFDRRALVRRIRASSSVTLDDNVCMRCDGNTSARKCKPPDSDQLPGHRHR